MSRFPSSMSLLCFSLLAFTACDSVSQSGYESAGFEEEYGSGYDESDAYSSAHAASQVSNDYEDGAASPEPDQRNSGGSVDIYDSGLGVVAQTYTHVPAGYRIQGQQFTDPSRGFGGDCHVEISGPKKRKLIRSAPVTTVAGEQQIFAFAEQSVAQALQRAGESGRRTGEWHSQPSAAGGGMRLARSEFKTPDGRAGEIQLTYSLSNGSGMGFPLVFFCFAQDLNSFTADMAKINAGLKNNSQWSKRQQQADANGIASLNAGHQARMNDMRSNFEAGQKAHATRQAGFDQANAAWRENFNKPSSGGYRSSGSDEMQNRRIDVLTETERYYDPSTGYDQRLEAGYDRTFTNGQGEYYQTNDAMVDPVGWQGDWQEVEPIGN